MKPVKITPKEYKQYLRNLSRENEPKRMPKDLDKLMELVKRYMGMTDAISQIVMPFVIKQKMICPTKTTKLHNFNKIK